MIKIANKNKRRKISKKSMIIAVCFCLIILLIIAIETISKLSEYKEDNKAELVDSNYKPKTETDILEEANCKLLDKSFENENLNVKIEFSKRLYDENNNSNKEYFENLIKELTAIYGRSFTIYDEEKNILISVTVYPDETYTYLINSMENYFENTKEKNEELKKYEKIESIKEEISIKDVSKISLNEWKINGAGIEAKGRDEKFLYYENYKARVSGFFVQYLEFSKEFQEETINGIKVGENFEEIKQKLGNPQFENSKMIGYKTKDGYVFYYNDIAKVYPNKVFYNYKLENLINEYASENSKNSNLFASEITQEFDDFIIQNENEITILNSPARGIIIKLDKNGNIMPIIYNNYNLTENTKQMLREEIYTSKLETNLILETEINL